MKRKEEATMAMRLPERPLAALEELSPILRAQGLRDLTGEGCALPAVALTRAKYYRLDAIAELFGRLTSDEQKETLIEVCNEPARTKAKWWFRPREEAITTVEDAMRALLLLLSLTDGQSW